MPELRETNPNVAFEPSGVAVAALGGIAAGVAGFLIFIALVLAWGYPQATGDVFKAPTTLPPQPQLQSDPHADLAAYEAAKAARLASYGWVDRGKGIVHIPIEEAMRRLAARGIPGWPVAKETPGRPQP